jgi:hypothetical protein
MEVQHLTALSRLEFLDIRGTRITGEELRHLKGLKQLRDLDLTLVRDSG